MTRPAAPAEVYAAAMTGPEALAMLPLEESPWRTLYTAASLWIDDDESVVDLGCGTGRFAHCLYKGGWRHAIYVGMDFSDAVLNEARRYVGSDYVEFKQFDLESNDLQLHGGTFTCLEVLEHLNDDRKLLKKLPKNARLIFSVPNYDSDTHVRWFNSAEDVIDQYAHLLVVKKQLVLPVGDEGREIYLFDTVRR